MDDWEVSDEEMDAWAEEWRELDRAAAAYLAEWLPQVLEPVSAGEGAWLTSWSRRSPRPRSPRSRSSWSRRSPRQRLTDRGVWGLPRALHRSWTR